MSQRHQRRLQTGATFLTVLFLLLLTTTANRLDANGPEGPVVAIATAGATGITFEPRTASAEWVLTVAGGGGVRVTKVFRPGERLLLALVDDRGAPFADGYYAYALGSASSAAVAGRFTVADGHLAMHGKAAGTPWDQVIPDDLIVQGSECVGLDCVNNENFGFDTIRLKENNLRIHFEDTSTAAGFPTNDWGIEVNASPSGGASYFAVVDRTAARLPFRVDAGAPVDALRVSSTGRIGIRTGTPVLDVHARTSNTPAMRFEQDSTGGFTAQTWDVAGNEANFFVRDVSGGSRLPFRIRPGAPTSSLDIAASGNVGIGTASPAQRLHVGGGARLEGALNLTSVATPAAPAAGAANLFFLTGANLRFQFSDGSQPLRILPGNFGGPEVEGILRLGWDSGVGPIPDAGKAHIWYELPDGSIKFRFSTGTTAQLTSAGVWTDASSRAFKKDIRALDAIDAASTLRGLTPVRYFTTGSTDEHVGFIAEEVPDLVATEGRQGLAPMDIVGVLTKVVQDQQARLDALAAEVAALKAALDQVRAGREK